MPRRLDASSPAFAQEFAALVAARREEPVDVREAVATILAEVRERGDAALCRYTGRFDRLELSAEKLRFSAAEIAEARAACDPADIEALETAAKRIRAFHERQLPRDQAWTDAEGVRLGLRWRPVDAVGLYVPGGRPPIRARC